MKTFLSILLISLSALLQAEAAENSVRMHLALKSQTNLKDIFDSGLRPWRVQGLEKGECAIGESLLSITVGEGPQFDFDVERASFTVLEGNVITGAVFFGHNVEPIPQAVERIKSICRSVGMPDDGLDAKAASVGNMPNSDDGWHNSIRVHGMDVGVTFSPLTEMRGTTKAQVWLTVGWLQKPGSYKFLKEPIKPPAGYENEKMEPPPRVPRKTPFSFQYVPPHSVDLGKNPPISTESTAKATIPVEAQEKPLQSIASESGRSSWWPWVVGGGLLLALVVFLFEKSK